MSLNSETVLLFPIKKMREDLDLIGPCTQQMVSQELISFLCDIPLTSSFSEKDLHSFLILLSCAVEKEIH